MLRGKSLSSNLSLFESETIFSRKIISEKKINYYGFMPGDFQVIWGWMIGESRPSPTLTETSCSKLTIEIPEQDVNQILLWYFYC